MYDHDVWHLSHQLSLLDIYFLIAATTLVVANNIALDRLLNRLLDRIDPLDWHR